jgi:hypothetical protein
MPRYRFEAMSYAGKSERGSVEGESVRAVRQALMAKQLVPVIVELETEWSKQYFWSRWFSKSKPISRAELAISLRPRISPDRPRGRSVANDHAVLETVAVIRSLANRPERCPRACRHAAPDARQRAISSHAVQRRAHHNEADVPV